MAASVHMENVLSLQFKPAPTSAFARPMLPALVVPSMKSLQTATNAVHTCFDCMLADSTRESRQHRNRAAITNQHVPELDPALGSVAARLDEIIQIVQTMLHGKYRTAFQDDAACIQTIRNTASVSAVDVSMLIHAMRNIHTSLQNYI